MKKLIYIIFTYLAACNSLQAQWLTEQDFIDAKEHLIAPYKEKFPEYIPRIFNNVPDVDTLMLRAAKEAVARDKKVLERHIKDLQEYCAVPPVFTFQEIKEGMSQEEIKTIQKANYLESERKYEYYSGMDDILRWIPSVKRTHTYVFLKPYKDFLVRCIKEQFYKANRYNNHYYFILSLLDISPSFLDSIRTTFEKEHVSPYIRAKLGDAKSEEEIIRQFKYHAYEGLYTDENIIALNKYTWYLLYIHSPKTMDAFFEAIQKRHYMEDPIVFDPERPKLRNWYSLAELLFTEYSYFYLRELDYFNEYCYSSSASMNEGLYFRETGKYLGRKHNRKVVIEDTDILHLGEKKDHE